LKRIFGILVLVAVLGLSNLPLAAMAQPNPQIDQNVATQYVNALLTTYSVLFNQSYGSNPSSTITKHFGLYRPVGYSFNVTVFWWNTNMSQVGFTFIPILSNNLLITIVSTAKGCNYLFGVAGIEEPNDCLEYFGKDGPGVILPSGFISSPDGKKLIPYTWIANSANVFNDTGASAGGVDAAKFLFGNGQSTIPPPSLYARLIESPLTYAGSVVFTILLGIQLYFGSIRDFVKVLGDTKERKKVVQELRQLRRLKVKRSKIN
jgi:hypothetical protein